MPLLWSSTRDPSLKVSAMSRPLNFPKESNMIEQLLPLPDSLEIINYFQHLILEILAYLARSLVRMDNKQRKRQ